MCPPTLSPSPAPSLPQLWRWIEGWQCCHRDDRHTGLHHMFVAKHSKFPLFHSWGLLVLSHLVLSCNEQHSAANGSKWAFSFSPLTLPCSTTHLSIGYQDYTFFLLFTLDETIKHVCFHACDKSSTSATFSGAMIQEQYLYSSHSTQLSCSCQKYLRPQYTKDIYKIW